MKKVFLFSLFYFISHFLQAQLLWEISGNGLKKPSFLFGTMHIGDDRVYDFGDSLMSKFNTCEAFAGEMVLNQNMMFEMLKHMNMAGDTTLSDLLSESEYKFVKKHIDSKMGFMAMMADRLKPIFTSVMLSEQKNQTSGRRIPIDLHFQQIAKEKNMGVLGLETFEEQIQAFNGIPLKVQAKMLFDALKNNDKDKNEMENLINLYHSQNIDSLYRLTNSQLSNDVNLQLLTIRNIKMAGRADKLMQKKALFIGIGAAHLAGKEGVISLLKQKGYKLRPIYKNKL